MKDLEEIIQAINEMNQAIEKVQNLFPHYDYTSEFSHKAVLDMAHKKGTLKVDLGNSNLWDLNIVIKKRIKQN